MQDASSEKITASHEDLLRQASLTAIDYMVHAYDYMDKNSFAEKDKVQLASSFMIAAAIDMAGATIAKQLRAGLEDLGNALENLAEAGKDIRVNGLDGLTGTIQNIAKMIDLKGGG